MSDLPECPRCGSRLVLDDSSWWVCTNSFCIRHLVPALDGRSAPEDVR